MIYIVPTKRGMGIEIWGTYTDLLVLYDFVVKFWIDEARTEIKGFENRDKLISGICYEIRKAKEGRRLKRTSGKFFLDEQKYYGCRFSWVHILFSLAAIKYNMKFCKTNKFDISQILLIEFWLENAMNSFDPATAIKLTGFVDNGLYGANNYIYQYMRSINLDYFMLGGGKIAFRKLPDLLRKGVYQSKEYKEYEKYLEDAAKRLDGKITDLELSDDHIDYENIKW